MRRRTALACLAFLMALAACRTDSPRPGPEHPDSSRVATASCAGSFDTPYVNDLLIRTTLQQHLAKLAAANPKQAQELGRQTRERRHCPTAIPGLPAEAIAETNLYDRISQSVLALGMHGYCPNCPKTHYLGGATAFVISTDGLAVTNFHVMNIADNVQAIGCLTRDGRFLAVKEVLAADPDADVAIIRLDGAGLTPLPLRVAAPPATEIAVVSHPESGYYTMTRGIVSRRCLLARGQTPEAPADPRSQAKSSKPAPEAKATPEAKLAPAAKSPPASAKLVETLIIDADYAKGSSGAPVCDLQGRVVGVVSSTNGIYYHDSPQAAHAGELQMVVKMCVPAEKILQLAGGLPASP